MNNYQIALSFAGEQRRFVAAVAERLAAGLGREQVFYDRFHEAELARPNLDLYLQEIYHRRSRLVVVFLGADYERKEWCGLEWRAVRDLIKSKKSEQIMLVRVDEGAVPGVFGIDGWVDARERDPGQVAKLILDRLGLLGTAPAVLRHAADGSSASGVTVVPKPPPHYLARPADLATLKSKLLASEAERVGITASRRAVGVQGMGGIGKSVLAAALTLEGEVTDAFPDGVFWMAVGQHADLVHLQVELAAAAGGVKAVVESPHQGKLLLSKLLAERAVLLVLDDVWSLELAAGLDVLGPKSGLLVTTRDAEILVGLGAKEYTVEVLAPEQADMLLADWAGEAVEDLPSVARRVARACGYLPLALAMIGAMVRHRPGGWADALERLERADLGKFHRNFPDYPYPDLLRAIEISVEALEPEERERYLELAVVPEEVAVPESVLETLWAPAGLLAVDARDLCAKLVARSFVQRDREGRLRLHDLQADYLRHETRDLRRLHGRLVDGYSARYPDGLSRGADDGYFFQWLPWHLRGAGRLAELRELLLCFSWLEAKLAATDINALIADYDALPDEGELRLVQAALRLSAHVLVEDPEELAGQLHGRLRDRSEDWIVSLVASSRPTKPMRWLRPLTASLKRPEGSLVRSLVGSDGIFSLAVLPDGRIVCGCFECIVIWDLDSDQVLRIPEDDLPIVEPVAVRQGSQIVSPSGGGNLRVWDVASGQTLRNLPGHAGKVGAVVVLPDGRVLSTCDDDFLRIWDLRPGSAPQTLNVGRSRALAVMPDGRAVSVSTNLDDLLIWDLESRKVVQTLRGAWMIRAVAVLPNGRIVAASYDKNLRIWDVESGDIVHVLSGHSAQIRAVVALPDGRVVSGSEDGHLRVWDSVSGEALQVIKAHEAEVRALAVHSQSRVISASGVILRVWEFSPGIPPHHSEGHSAGILAIAVMADGRAVSASYDHTLRVWDLAVGKPLKTLEGHSSWVASVAVLPDGRVVSASGDHTLRIWDLASGRSVKTLEGHSGPVQAVVVMPDGRIVSGSRDRTLRVWDAADGKIIRVLKGHSGEIWALALLAQKNRVVSASEDHTLRIWNLASGRTRVLKGHSTRVLQVALMSDGNLLSNSEDRTLRVWNSASGQVTATYGFMGRLAVLPKGRIVSASENLYPTLEIWQLGSGQMLAQFTLDFRPFSFAALADPSKFVVGDLGGHLHVLCLEAST